MSDTNGSIIKEQPTPMAAPAVTAEPTATRSSALKSTVSHVVQKFTTREGWLGNYDYAWLCMPTLPTMKAQGKRRLPPFYSLHANLPILLALSCGLQHALAMLAGLITPPIIFASSLNLDQEMQSYMVSASLIGCGILSLVQMSRLRLHKNYYLGTGLLSVVGTSFATLSTASAVSRRISVDHTTFLTHTLIDLQCDVQKRHMHKHNCRGWHSDARSMPGRIWKGTRHVAHLLLPRNVPLVRARAYSAAHLPSNGHWYRHRLDRSIAYW